MEEIEISINMSSIITSVMCTLLTAGLGACFAYFRRKVKAISKRMTAQDKATVSMLRRELRQTGNEFIIAGHTDYDALSDWQDMYEQYKALGGNGAMDNLKTQIEKLHMRGE